MLFCPCNTVYLPLLYVRISFFIDLQLSFSINYRYNTDRGDACQLGYGQDSNLVLQWTLGFLPYMYCWLAHLQAFLSLPPLPPVFDFFLNAAKLVPLIHTLDNHTESCQPV